MLKDNQSQLQYVKFIAVISIKLLKLFYTTTNMEQQPHLQKSKKQQLFALVQNSWHSWLSSCTALNVQRGHPIRQLTVAEREEHGPVIFLVATHRKFFIVHCLQKNEGECPISCMKERAKNLNDFSYNLKMTSQHF